MSIFDAVGAITGGIGDMFMGNRGMQKGGDLAGQAANNANSLMQPQRIPFQNQLTGMLQDPSSFLKNDALIGAQSNMIGDWASKNFAKSGNMPMYSILGSAQLGNVIGNEFNQRVNDLTVLGGYNQAAPNVQNAYGQAIANMPGFMGQMSQGVGGAIGAGMGLLGSFL